MLKRPGGCAILVSESRGGGRGEQVHILSHNFMDNDTDTDIGIDSIENNGNIK